MSEPRRFTGTVCKLRSLWSFLIPIRLRGTPCWRTAAMWPLPGTLRLIAVAFGVSMIVAFEKRLRARAEVGSDDILEPAAHRI